MKIIFNGSEIDTLLEMVTDSSDSCVYNYIPYDDPLVDPVFAKRLIDIRLLNEKFKIIFQLDDLLFRYGSRLHWSEHDIVLDRFISDVRAHLPVSDIHDPCSGLDLVKSVQMIDAHNGVMIDFDL